MMKAVTIVADKAVEVQQVPVPKPAAGEILVKVHYVAQNPTDWKAAASRPPGRIVGCDFAGTVEDPNDSKWTKDQRVAGFVYGASDNPSRGAFAEYLVTEASLVFAIPDSTSFEEAAAIPLALATAVQALFQRLGLPEPAKPATSFFPVLVYGGASSVGMYSIQLCKLAGLFVITTASARNHELLKRLGADATVDYNDSDWVGKARDLGQGKLKHAFDVISETTTTPSVAQALAPGGHVMCVLPRKQAEIDASLDVKVESTLVYSVFERPLPHSVTVFENTGEATPKDKAVWEKYLQLLPGFLYDGKITANPTRKFGGIEDIPGGFKVMQEGGVKAEKLVYQIA